MNIQPFINTHIIFRLEELMAFAKAQANISSVSEKNLKMMVYRYCKKGRLINIRKGLYAVISEQEYRNNNIHPLLIAGKATSDSVISYHSAMESHNIAYTDFNEHIYLTKCFTNEFDFQGQHYRGLRKPMLSNNTEHWIESISILGITILRTTLERTVVDVLDRPDLSGGWEEVTRSLERITSPFKTEEAINYALSLGRASIIAKLGYFLETQLSFLNIDAKHLNKLLPHVPKQPYYINRNMIGQGTYSKKWKIIVPNELHERQWEEPDEHYH